MTQLSTAQKSQEVLNYLKARRSCKLKLMGDIGPSEDEIEEILSVAARVPDHGKLFPWYFIVLNEYARKELQPLLRQAYAEEEPDATEAKLELESERFLRAPLVILVVSRARRGKKPLWEQLLSAGAACYNLCLAANALGYGANWLTEWYSYNTTFKQGLGLEAQDHIAGAIYIGKPVQESEERERPDLSSIVTYWSSKTPLNKGERYDKNHKSWPHSGFSYSNLSD